MKEAEVKRFLDDQKHKCKFFEGTSTFRDVMSEAAGISLFRDNVTDEDQLERYPGIAKTSVVNEGNGTEVLQCPSFFDGLLCWSQIDAPGTATLPCPPAPIMGYTNLASDNLTAVASKVCLANGEWYRNSNGVSWSNYSLCVMNSTHYIIGKNYLSLYETPAELALLNKWLPIIKMVSDTGYITSFTTLIVAMVVFSLLRKLRNPRNRLHMHLFASFIMRAFMTLLKDCNFINSGLALEVVFVDGRSPMIKEYDTWVCKVITSLWQYFIVANYLWILMEGLYLHNLIFLALCIDSSTITLYIVLGWGIPILVVVPWIIIRATMEDTLCWTTHGNSSLFFIIKIPIIVSILFSFLLFLNIGRVILVKLNTSAHLQRKKMKYKKWAKSTLVLVPLFGIHYTIFLGLYCYKDYRVELVWLFCDQLFASFQGTFVAFLYCLLNGEVRTEIRRVWRTQRSKREVDPFIFYLYTRSSRNGINRKRYRSKGDNAITAMKELSMKDIK